MVIVKRAPSVTTGMSKIASFIIRHSDRVQLDINNVFGCIEMRTEKFSILAISMPCIILFLQLKLKLKLGLKRKLLRLRPKLKQEYVSK